jgi:hypothetical protein
MGYTTTSLGLTLVSPQKGQRDWSDTLLTDFIQPISSHDHTGDGKGSLIGANALSPSAVTTAKLADGAVTQSKLAGGDPTELIPVLTAYEGQPLNTGTFSANSCFGTITKSGRIAFVSLLMNFNISGQIIMLKLSGIPTSATLGREQELPARIAGLDSQTRDVSVYIPDAGTFALVYPLDYVNNGYKPFVAGNNQNTVLTFIYLTA